MQLCAQDLLTSEKVLNPPRLLNEERSLVVADALRKSGSLRLQVQGESMLPTLWPRAIVEIAGCSVVDVKRGEIVLAIRDGRLFLHRFLGRKQGGFVLRGDSMPGPDPIFCDDALLGKLVDDNAAVGYHLSPAHLLYRAMGFVVCYCTPLRRALLRLHCRWEIWRQEPEASARRTVDLEA